MLPFDKFFQKGTKKDKKYVQIDYATRDEGQPLHLNFERRKKYHEILD